MINQMGPEPLFLLPEHLLRQADDVIPLLARLANVLLPEEAHPKLIFYAERLPSIDRPFLLLGRPDGDSPEAPLELEDGRLRLRNGRGELVLEATADNHAAVLQLARIEEQKGLWLLPDGQDRYPAPADITLNRSDIAWLDERGIALALQSDQDGPDRSADRWIRDWLERFDGYRDVLLLAAGALAALFLILLLMIRARRRRRPAPRNAKE